MLTLIGVCRVGRPFAPSTFFFLFVILSRVPTVVLPSIIHLAPCISPLWFSFLHRAVSVPCRSPSPMRTAPILGLRPCLARDSPSIPSPRCTSERKAGASWHLVSAQLSCRSQSQCPRRPHNTAIAPRREAARWRQQAGPCTACNSSTPHLLW